MFMRRSVTYPDPNRPGWWARMLAANTAPPPTLEIEPDVEPALPGPEPTDGSTPFDPASWAWTATVDQNQALPIPGTTPPPLTSEPIREPVKLDAEPWPDELACRRTWWRPDGGWITLADGLPWALPVIDLDHLIRYPALRDALANVRAMDLGPKLTPFSDLDACREAARRLNELHDRMALLGVALLTLNYDVDPADLARLALVPNPMDWAETISQAANGLGTEAVALVQRRGIPVCWN